MEQDHVRVKKRTKVYEGAIIDVYQDVVVIPGGGFETWDFISHKNEASCVVPITKDKKILLVKQFRTALDRYTWELPAGCKGPEDKDLMESAKREMLEETGYTSDELVSLMTLKSTVATCDEEISVFYAENCYKVQEQQLDEAEMIETKEWDLEVLLEHIYSGELQDAKTVAGILAYKALSASWHL